VSTLYYEQYQDHDESPVDGLVILGDFDRFSEIKGCRVIVFNDSGDAQKASKEMKKSGDLDVAFKAALSGNAEEISIDRLVRFYLDNNM
jgi:hypothetical protein